MDGTEIEAATASSEVIENNCRPRMMGTGLENDLCVCDVGREIDVYTVKLLLLFKLRTLTSSVQNTLMI